MGDPSTPAAVLDPPTGALWDYSVVSFHVRHNEDLEAKLCEYGRQGWELVSVNIPMTYEYQCFFRRRMPS